MTHVLAYCRLSGYPGDRADYAAEPLAAGGESRDLDDTHLTVDLHPSYRIRASLPRWTLWPAITRNR